MRALTLLLLGAAVAGCAVAPQPRSPYAEGELRQALAGKVAQAPVNCVGDLGSQNMVVIDDQTVLFRQGDRVYRNDLRGRCFGLVGNTLLIKRSSADMCTGDIAQVMASNGGVPMGSCVLGPFTPYVPAR